MNNRTNPQGADELRGANGRNYRLAVHQATGMVAVQSNCSVAAALDLLVEYAAEHECTVEQAAWDVVECRLRLR
jgi:hypothetical protein